MEIKILKSNFILLVKKIYILLCWLYRNILGYFQKIFLSNKKIINKKICFSIDLKKNNYEKILNKDFKKLKKEYQVIYLMDKNTIYKLLKIIFNKELRNKITKETGYKYSIDYCIFYKNLFIPRKDSHRSIYANHLHVDKPYSRNMLKIIIPISVADKEHGLIIVKSKNPLERKTKYISLKDFTYFCSNKNNTLIYGFYPSRCLHKALSPAKDNHCLQIMVQLNPSNFWKINKKVEERQSYKEPKFTDLINIFDKFLRI